MFSFANPYLLYLLLLIPAVFGLYLLARMARRRNLKTYGKPSTLAPLMPEASKYTPAIKMILSLIIIAALVIVLARPRAGAKEETSEVQGIEVMICLDVSNSMLASSTDDPKGVSRLQRAKLILEKLIDNLKNDKVGLIVFAGDAYTQGTAIGAAVDMAMASFTPDDDMQKAIIIITDGENFEDDPIAAVQTASKQGIQVDVIGLGSTKGALIPLGKNGQFMRDDNGNPVTTRLNEEMARQIAEEGNGIYVQGASSSVVKDIDEQLKTLATSSLEKVTYMASAEQFPVFAWIALVFLILDIFVLERKFGWLKKINFFSK